MGSPFIKPAVDGGKEVELRPEGLPKLGKPFPLPESEEGCKGSPGVGPCDPKANERIERLIQNQILKNEIQELKGELDGLKMANERLREEIQDADKDIAALKRTIALFCNSI